MKKLFSSLTSLVLLISISCNHDPDVTPIAPLPESTTQVQGKAILKVLPHTQGWIALQETIQPQYMVTQPKRKLAWLTTDFHETSSYNAPEGWSLIDAVVHPSGQVSAAIINLDIKRSHLLEVKLLRIKNDGSVTELMLQPLPASGERTRYFPASLDRLRLEAFGEDVYTIVRWEYNEVEASRFGFNNDQFQIKWQTLVEPDAFAGSIGIIGGGYDNFHQGDRYFFVYSGIDSQGNLYVAVPCHEDLLINHDLKFNENLTAEGNPGTYDWGVAVLTKLSATGERKYSKLQGTLPNIKKRLISMRVGEGNVYFVGRIKISSEPNGWDAWILSADAATGNKNHESQIDIRQGDMFWDAHPLKNGGVLAVGTTDYTQNPAGLSVSDSRLATAVVLDASGKMTKEIPLPQGPSARGSEAMFVQILNNGSAIFAGVHNAPGTHADVYCDGYIAVRDFVVE